MTAQTPQSLFSQLKEWLSLIRFSHTLFALPCALGTTVVASGGVPPLRPFLLILFCMVTARNTAMAFNRLADRKVDALNPRTAQRHLPAGKLSPRSVALFVALNSLLFLGGAYLLNPLAAALALPTLLVLCGYSLLKRFTWASQFGLGIALGLSPAGAWVAIQGEIALFPLLIGVIILFWSAGFDTIYATQDLDEDLRQGLHSIPTRFGLQGSLKVAKLLHLITLIIAVAVGLLYQLQWPWWGSVAAAAIAIVVANRPGQTPSLETLNAGFFLANIAVSLLLMVGMIGTTLLAP